MQFLKLWQLHSKLLALSRVLSSSTLALLRKQYSLDVRKDSSLGDGYTSQELVELLVITNSQLKIKSYQKFASYKLQTCRCLGIILDFLLSRAAFPASSRISAARYSITAAI